MSSYSRQQLEDWLKTLEVKGNVLDCGGAQNPVIKRLKNKKIDLYDIVDLQNPHEKKQEATIIADLNYYYHFEKKYNVAFLLEVSEYLWNTNACFTSIWNALIDNGKLYASFHWTYGLHKPEKLDYLRYTDNAITRMLIEAGFSNIKIIPRLLTDQGVNLLSQFYQAEGMRIIKDKNAFVSGWLVEAEKIVF